jgi:hypothetical protein
VIALEGRVGVVRHPAPLIRAAVLDVDARVVRRADEDVLEAVAVLISEVGQARAGVVA